MADNTDNGVSVFADEEWTRAISGLDDCGARIVDVFNARFQEAGLRPHTVTHRVKRRLDAEKKIVRKARDDYTLGSLTDLLGFRIITYFDDEVDLAGTIVRRLFDIDPVNSVDKRTILDPDRFGYSSLHYVARLGADRVGLAEYAAFKELRFEIQIRSILQHAWAEIEHDLGYNGYKSGSATPEWLKRRFARLAGVLELVGNEFVSVRDRAAEHRTDVETTVASALLPEAGIATPAPTVDVDVQIDRDSIAAYIRGSARLAEIEDRAAVALERARNPEVAALSADLRARELRIAGFTTLHEIDKALDASSNFLWRFMVNWFERPELGRRSRASLAGGTGLLYLAVARVVAEPWSRARELLKELDLENWPLDRLMAEVRRALDAAAGDPS